MKFFLRLILIGILTYSLSFFAPWWIIVITAFIGGISLPGNSISVFVSGFLGVGIVWMGYAWALDTANESQFSRMIGEVLTIGDPLLLIAATGVIGGVCGGFSAISGSLLRKGDPKKKPTGYYQ